MSPVKADSKYFPLYEFLRAQPDDRLSMSMEAIDRLIEAGLPGSAYKSRAFWSNRSQGALQAAAWMDAGYHVHSVDLDRAVVTFSRAKVTYRVDREGGEVLWNAGMVRALRQHMDLNQAELAQILGVRQQTVSEWETGIYRPTRGRSKHLTLVAEREDFPFRADREE
jgi:hypothetical protein